MDENTVYLHKDEYAQIYAAMERIANERDEARKIAQALYSSAFPNSITKELPADHWLFEE